MKKLFSTVLVLVLVFSAMLVLTACADDEEPIDYAHTIVFYSSQGDKLQAKTAIAIANFEAKYPGWKVVHTAQGGYDQVRDKVISDLQVDQQPDLAYCYPDHVAMYLQTGKVLDMNQFKNSTETVNDVLVGYTDDEWADFVSAYLDEGKAQNFGGYETYGYAADDMLTIPFVKSTELLYYNKTALDGAGLTVATTWDELWAQCVTLRAKYPTATPLGYDSEANWFITMCQQNGWGYTEANGTNHYTFNNAQAQAWLQQLSTYYDLGYITTQAESGAYTSNLFVKGVEDGGIIYCVGSSGGASYQATDKFTWGIAPIPASGTTDVSKSVISQGPSLVMLKAGYGVENADEKAKMTWLFVKELLDPTFQATFSMESGYNPCRNSTYDVPTYQEFLDDETKATAKAVKVAQTIRAYNFTSPAFIGSSTARTQVGNALVFALTGQKTPEKALADAYKNCGGK